VHEACFFSQLLPVARLDPGIQVADNSSVTFGDEHERIALLQLRSEKPRVALVGVRRRTHEAVVVEVVVDAEQACAQATDVGEIGTNRPTDNELV
jgi:hypothetical protein